MNRKKHIYHIYLIVSRSL